MSTEQFEQQAQQLTMESTRQTVRLTGVLTRTTWDEARSLVGDALSRAGRAITRSGDGRTHTGGRLSVASLEKVTHGVRTGVDLTNPAVARQIQRELRAEGVTFAVTKAEGKQRIHIAAGNAEQLNHALEVAEARVARRVERQEVRADSRAAARAAVQERVRNLPGRPEPVRSDPQVVQMLSLGVEGNGEAARQARVQRAQALIEGRAVLDAQGYRNVVPSPVTKRAHLYIEYALVEAGGDMTRAVQDDRFVKAVAEHLGVSTVYRQPDMTNRAAVVVDRPLERRENFEKLADVVNKARKDMKVKRIGEKVLAKVVDLDRIPAVERVVGGAAR